MKDIWINVKDRRPHLGYRHRYLFINGKDEITIGYAHNWEKESNEYMWIIDEVREKNEVAKWWMPLPDKPSEI